MKTDEPVSEGTYFLCSKPVVDFAKPTEVSRPFKSGYKHDEEEHFVAVIDFVEIEKHYHQLPENEQYGFWCKEIVPGTMDVSKITLKGMRENGVFLEISIKIELSTLHNIAMVLYNLSEKFNCTPIELINKVTKRK